MSKTTKKQRKEERIDNTRFVPPVNPLFREFETQFKDGDLVLGIVEELHDVIPRVGLVIKANCITYVSPPQHDVLWADGIFETTSEDDLAPVAHCNLF